MKPYYTINHITYTPSELLSQCEKALLSHLPEWELAVWAFVKEWLTAEDAIELKTSGSTGTPKTIKVEKKYLRNSALMTLEFLHLQAGDTALLCLSANYIAGKMMIVRALEGGLNLLLHEAVGNPLKGCSDKITFAAMVPLQVEKVLAEEGTARLQAIDHLIIGGAAVSTTLQESLRPLSNEIWSTYGMTETVSHIAMRPLSGAAATEGFVPMPGVKLTTDERGCLQIEASHLCAEPVVTNDLVALDTRGHFRFLGRYDNVINSGGIKLMPEVIEQKIASLIEDRFFISSLADEHLGQKLVLYIETTAPEKYEWTALQEKMADILPKYERPKVLICLPKLEETQSGKVKRHF